MVLRRLHNKEIGTVIAKPLRFPMKVIHLEPSNLTLILKLTIPEKKQFGLDFQLIQIITTKKKKPDRLKKFA